jgi:hypothetical protein
LNILVVFSISNCICGKNFRTLSCAGGEISRKRFLKKFIKNFQTNKNQFWVLLIGFSYLSQNLSFKFKNLVLYLKMLALQNGNIFIQIWKFDWAAISAFRRDSRAVTRKLIFLRINISNQLKCLFQTLIIKNGKEEMPEMLVVNLVHHQVDKATKIFRKRIN